MSVKTVDYTANQPTASAQATASSQRGPSEIIWAAPGSPNAWIEDFLQDPSLGMHFFDDFEVAGTLASAAAANVQGSLGRWACFQGSTATITDGSLVGGVLVLTPGTATTSRPVTLGSLTGCFQITSGSSGGLQSRLAFEARVAMQSVTASKRDAFVGLVDQFIPASTFPITVGTSTNNLLSTMNLIGFYNQYSGGAQDWGFVYQLASTAPVFVTGLQSLVSSTLGSAIGAGTFYKLGFVYDPFPASQQITVAANGQTVGNVAGAMLRVFVNGVPAAAFLTKGNNILASNFPTGVMGPCVSIMNDVSSVGASTNAGSLSIDFLRVAQNAAT